MLKVLFFILVILSIGQLLLIFQLDFGQMSNFQGGYIAGKIILLLLFVAGAFFVATKAWK